MRSKSNKLTAKPKKSQRKITWLLYVLLFLSIIAYAFYNNPVIGIMAIALLVAVLILDFGESVREEGAKKTVIEIGIAITAVVIIYIVLILVLGTRSPIDTVASCSMLPILHRGDMVILKGTGNITDFLNTNHIPIVNVSSQAFNKMESNMSSEFLIFYPYTNNKSDINTSFVVTNNSSIALYNQLCLAKLSSVGEDYLFYKCAVPQSQYGNLIKYNYSIGRMMANNLTERIVYTSSISIANTTIVENYSNPIIVYSTTSHDLVPLEDIIHRLYAAIRVGGSYYLLTKGDNNPMLDIQFGVYPTSSRDVVGYVLAHVPIIGYMKLLVSGQVGEVAGCNQTILRS